MGNQLSFTDLEYSNRERKTKREEFLDAMDEIVDWDEIVAEIKPFYYRNARGRRAKSIETMLRMYLLQRWFGLSDEGIEDAIYDSYAMRRFMHLNFLEERVPDVTTLYRFKKLLADNGMEEHIFGQIQDGLAAKRLAVKAGNITDAALARR